MLSKSISVNSEQYYIIQFFIMKSIMKFRETI